MGRVSRQSVFSWGGWGGGLEKLHDSHFAYHKKHLTRYMLVTWYADYNHHFLTYFAKNPVKITCFYGFIAKKLICDHFRLFFMYIMNFPEISRAH